MEKNRLFPIWLRVQQNKERKEVFDINIINTLKNKSFDSIELEVLVLPYDRQISANEISFLPFDAYKNDLSKDETTLYREISANEDKLFGIFLAFIIFLIFLFYNQSEIFSLQSIISLLGAYTIGKEFWKDIDNQLVNLTKGSRLKFIKNLYSYISLPTTTIYSYTGLAQERRYGTNSLHPEKFDYIELSNSEILRTFFNFRELKKDFHYASLHIDDNLIDKLIANGFLFGTKVTLNKHYAFLKLSNEYFQSFENGNYGCLDKNQKWSSNNIFCRLTFSIWRFKLYLNNGVINNIRLLEVK